MAHDVLSGSQDGSGDGTEAAPLASTAASSFPTATADDARSAKLRAFFARYVAQRGGASDDSRIERAFASVPREPFAGEPPWLVAGPLSFYPNVADYVRTPDGDPAFLYQDALIALDAARGINIGEPGFHAFCLGKLALREGERAIHVGAGSGYYSAILAELVGLSGHVDAYEIDAELASRARRNLEAWTNVVVHHRSGADGALPTAQAIYVNAACVRPSEAWLQALAPGGRLMFPLQQQRKLGGMLLAQRPWSSSKTWPARIVTRAIFVGCEGLQDDEAGERVTRSFAGAIAWHDVRAMRFDAVDRPTCWLSGDGWWLSTAAIGTPRRRGG